MKYNIADFFEYKNFTEQELEYHINQYKTIENDFKNRKFNFNNLDLHKIYIDVLLRYLEVNGYGFLRKSIKTNNIDHIELANLLIDSKLIDKPTSIITSDLDKKIVYEKEFGYKQTFTVKFEVNSIPFKVFNLHYRDNANLTCKLQGDTVSIFIDIKEGDEINFIETIMVYTSLGIETIELAVKCNTRLNSDIVIENFEDFIDKCKEYPIQARSIFKNKRFREWLMKKSYISQVINYDEAIKLSNQIKDSFENFCMLNNIVIPNDRLNINSDTISVRNEEVIDKGLINEREINERAINRIESNIELSNKKALNNKGVMLKENDNKYDLSESEVEISSVEKKYSQSINTKEFSSKKGNSESVNEEHKEKEGLLNKVLGKMKGVFNRSKK